MGCLSRIGVATGSGLLTRFDDVIAKQGYTDRSETRNCLVPETITDPCAPAVVATVALAPEISAMRLIE